MPGPKSKYWGSLSLDNIGKAVKQVPAKFKDDPKYGKQLTVDAALWEDGNISLSVWDKESKETIKIGNLRLSQFQDGGEQSTKTTSEENDLPF